MQTQATASRTRYEDVSFWDLLSDSVALHAEASVRLSQMGRAPVGYRTRGRGSPEQAGEGRLDAKAGEERISGRKRNGRTLGDAEVMRRQREANRCCGEDRLVCGQGGIDGVGLGLFKCPCGGMLTGCGGTVETWSLMLGADHVLAADTRHVHRVRIGSSGMAARGVSLEAAGQIAQRGSAWRGTDEKRQQDDERVFQARQHSLFILMQHWSGHRLVRRMQATG
jgi:hypothetical protein